MKNKKNINVDLRLDQFDESTRPMALFTLSNMVSKENSKRFLRLSKTSSNAKKKVEGVRSLKKAEKEIYTITGVFDALKKDFLIDGAVKISGNELLEFNKFIEDIGEKGYLGNYFTSPQDLMSELILRFGYFSENAFIFRNQSYYFLLNGIDVEDFDKFTSINDLIIKEINFDEFVGSICDQYSAINKQFKMYGNYVLRAFLSDLDDRKDSFCSEIKNVLSEDTILDIRKTIQTGQFSTGHEPVDKMFKTQWEDTLVKLERFRKIVEKYESSEATEDFQVMIKFLVNKQPFFDHCKIVFGIDIDAIVKSHFSMEMPLVVRKMVLGLIDAKINILAFVQNVFQIVTNINFLDPEYLGSLIIERDVVRNIQKTCPIEFLEFKNLQKNYVGRYAKNPLRPKLDDVIGIFTKILLDNSSISYLRLIEYGAEGRLNNQNDDKLVPKILIDFIEITKKFFKLIQKFSLECDIFEQKKQIKKSKKGLEYFPSDRHIKIKQQIFKRLIRVYREENSPLVMIKTAQNALNHVLLRGYDPENDVLHIMSVNYGGALTGFFAKHVFLHGVNNGRALVNTASVIYSLYDVRNANSFARLTDYPFSNVISDKNMSEDVRGNFSKKNWLLIFDDNTNSGETLDNIRLLAKETGFFGRIDMFPCRASFNLDNYKNNLNEHQKLAMIVSSALEVRRAKVNPKGLRYKELLGTIVGRRLWKLENKNKIRC